ncbi:MAG: PspC family transcriptional regulator [Saprospiraceae bacterium]|nr:PspC family transcriptional regulator [Saprospiraceae bacterium]
MKHLRDILERSAFGVCDYLGAKMRVPSATVRLYFIYVSCIALASPIIVYLFLAFWLNIKQYIRNSKRIIWS